MKTAYKIEKAEGKKLAVAARINNVKLGPAADIGGTKAIIELDFRTYNDLIDLGRSLASVSGTEFDELLAAEKAKADAKKKS